MSDNKNASEDVNAKILRMLENLILDKSASEIEKTIFIAYAYGFFVESMKEASASAPSFNNVIEQLDNVRNRGKEACLGIMKNDGFWESLEREEKRQENVIFEAKKADIVKSSVVDLSAYKNLRSVKKEDLN